MRERDELVDRAALSLSGRMGDHAPQVFLTLGSGLASVADRIEDATDVPVGAVPGLSVSRVPGHVSTLRFGTLGGTPVMAQLGRIHLYEDHGANDVVRTVEVAARLGATKFVVTNAAGGLVPEWEPGDLMLITDHLNLTGKSPLTGVQRDGAPVFLDMAGAYDATMASEIRSVAESAGVALREGVYAGLTGPAYETPAEVRMLRTMGAQAVGMSTVLEVIAARAHGMSVLGISSITNVHGDGVSTNHEEVVEVGARASTRLADLLLRWLG